MGGRGANAPILSAAQVELLLPTQTLGDRLPPLPESYEYTAIRSAELTTGGARYPFLEGLNREWTIVTRTLNSDEQIHPFHTYGLAQPTLRWVKDNTIVDLYVDGMSMDDYFEASGLRFHNENKGPYVLSKRVSRIMRPYFASDTFSANELSIRYLEPADYGNLLDDPASGPKVFDGAGVISRAMLEKLTIRDDMSESKKARLRREIAKAGRVEFTILTARGQDKGHAIVSDDLDVDFLIPHDTKAEITLETGQTWVGIDFVHSKNHMRIDVQSLINLYPFFDTEQYAQWLNDEGELFIQAVQSGDVTAALARIEPGETLEEVQAWAMREFYASGGQPQDFQYHTKALINRHLARLNASAEGKLRIPIPGGRYYVMPAGVGRAAGAPVTVEPGQIHIDHQHATAWVSDQDWLSFQDSPQQAGIAAILGGADNDDALWLHPFTDHDGTRKVLAWRSPNQLGEYVTLQPTANSSIPEWQTAEGDIQTFIPADSRKLPKRIDTLTPAYQGLVDQTSGQALSNGEPYSLDAMNHAISRALENQGALGMYCNSLMLNKALYGSLPASPPAPLEDVIDASVKTGADLSRVKQWNYDNSRAILSERTPIPALLHQRLSIDRDAKTRSPQPVPTHDHWLDDLHRSLKSHIQKIETARDELARQAKPRRALFDVAAEAPETIRLGGQLNATYTRAIRSHTPAGQPPSEADHEAARLAVEGYLARFPEQQHTAILRGAMASAYMGETPSSDNAVWLMGEKRADGTRAPGIAQKSIQALREIGALDELGQTEYGLIAYPAATTREAATRSARVTGVWFNRHLAECRANGQPLPALMQDVPRPRQRELKAQVARLAETKVRGMRLTVTTDSAGQRIARTSDGDTFGYVHDADDLSPGDVIELALAASKDGNLRVQYTRVYDAPQSQPDPGDSP